MGSYSSAKKVMEWKELLIIACCVEVVLFIFGYLFWPNIWKTTNPG